MRLWIAEKPSMARDIAKCLGAARPINSPPTHYCIGDDTVTWCYGHMLELAEPQHYGEQYLKWSSESLPIIPDKWELLPISKVKSQIAVIRGLVKNASCIVHAGDPDREGQLLVDELLEYLKNRLPVARLWAPSLDDKSLRRYIERIKSNTEYQSLKISAESRQRGDWLVGMNLTRAYTLSARKGGFDGVLSIGRVQTPTLGLVCERDLAIENFRPKDYFGIIADIDAGESQFQAKWIPSERVELDKDGRVLDRAVAQAVAERTAGKSGRVTTFDAEEKKQSASLPYHLGSLQTECSKTLGLSAQETLNIAQSLYEAKLTTYPRTDCRYLPEEQHALAEGVLAGLSERYPELVALADSSIKTAAWNDAKLTAHFGIIPTGKTAALTGNQAMVYDMIARSYIAQFFPPYTYLETCLTIEVAGECFKASGKVPRKPGWQIVFGDELESYGGNDENSDHTARQSLPALRVGHSVLCTSATVQNSRTTKPKHFTEGALIEAMESIHRYVDDPAIKQRLKETSGLGTPATRAAIIETLKDRGFLAVSGKQITCTLQGRKLIEILPPAVKSPGLTALFEQLLEAIVDGRISQGQFMAKQTEYVQKYVRIALESQIDLPPAHPCPVCKEGHLRKRKSTNGWFWGCSRYSEGCSASYDDSNGKPATVPKRSGRSGARGRAKAAK